jgi:hypothetical protein
MKKIQRISKAIIITIFILAGLSAFSCSGSLFWQKVSAGALDPPEPTFSHEPGYYLKGQVITINNPPGHRLRYTTDNSDPVTNITISETEAETVEIVLTGETPATIIKAVARNPEFVDTYSEIVTATYTVQPGNIYSCGIDVTSPCMWINSDVFQLTPIIPDIAWGIANAIVMDNSGALHIGGGVGDSNGFSHPVHWTDHDADGSGFTETTLDSFLPNYHASVVDMFYDGTDVYSCGYTALVNTNNLYEACYWKGTDCYPVTGTYFNQLALAHEIVVHAGAVYMVGRTRDIAGMEKGMLWIDSDSDGDIDQSVDLTDEIHFSTALNPNEAKGITIVDNTMYICGSELINGAVRAFYIVDEGIDLSWEHKVNIMSSDNSSRQTLGTGIAWYNEQIFIAGQYTLREKGQDNAYSTYWHTGTFPGEPDRVELPRLDEPVSEGYILTDYPGAIWVGNGSVIFSGNFGQNQATQMIHRKAALWINYQKSVLEHENSMPNNNPNAYAADFIVAP